MVGEQHVSADPEDLGYDFVADARHEPGPARRARRPWSCCATGRGAAVLPLRRVLRDPPRLLRADLGARRAVLGPAGEPARLAGHAARHGLVQAERAVARPRRRRGAERARRAGPRRRHARDPHHRPRAAVPGRQVDAVGPRARRAADHARPGRLPRRARDRRARVPDRPVPDDLRADRRSSGPSTCRAARCCRSCARERREVNDAVFGEITYHAAYDPQRAVRTRRHKYIRRYGDRDLPVLPEHRRQPEQGPAAPVRPGRDAAAARGALRPACSTRTRRATSSTSPEPRGRAGRAARAARHVDGDDRRPAARRPGAGAAGRAGQRPGRRSRPPRRRARRSSARMRSGEPVAASTGRWRACGGTRARAGARRRARRARRRRRAAGPRAGRRPASRRSPRSARRARAAARRRRARRRPRAAPRRPPAAGGRPGPRRRSCRGTRERIASASSRSPRAARMRASATPASARAGSSASARRRSSSPPDSTSASASDGSSASRNRATAGGGCAPTNSDTTAPSRNALTAGMLWIRNAAAMRWFASVSSLASATLPARSVTACSSTGVSCRHGPHHAAQKSTTTGSVARALDDVLLERGLGGVEDHASRLPGVSEFTVRSGSVALAGEEAGDGVPVVLLHGLTATRRYVVMGSRALERSGHRVVAYDARGHGRSGARPGRRRLRLRGCSPPTCSPCSTTAGSSARCWPAPRWARTPSCGSRSTTATAWPGSSLVTPAYTPEGEHADLARWDALSDGLRTGGVEGFVAAYGDPGVPEAWRDTVTRVLHQRLAAHEHPDAVADALRAVRARARSRRGPSWTSSTSRRSSSPAATTSTPATPTRSASATPRRSPGAELRSEEPGRVAAGVAGRAALQGDRRAGRARHRLTGSIRAISGSAHSTTVSRS